LTDDERAELQRLIRSKADPFGDAQTRRAIRANATVELAEAVPKLLAENETLHHQLTALQREREELETYSLTVYKQGQALQGRAEAAERLHREAVELCSQELDKRVAAERRLKDLEGDAKRLDWLNDEHKIVNPVAALVVKRHYDRASSEWANVSGDIRKAIDAALSSHHPTAPVPDERADGSSTERPRDEAHDAG
jgi:hypothetical protein